MDVGYTIGAFMNEIRKTPSSDRKYMIFAIRIMGEITYLIAVPIVVLVILGKWLDGRFHTEPKFLIAGFIVAALFSGTTVWRRARQLGREYQALDTNIEDESKKV